MANRLKVTELDFDTIKSNLKDFLKQQNEFSDYNFDGSGLDVLLDVLAYNTHYNAYYLNMVANESFLDTAALRDSVVSHAKTLGYTPRSVRAPKAVIDFTVTADDDTPETLTVPRGYTFVSNLIDNRSYNFIVLEDQTVTKSNTQFVFEDLEIYEGQLINYSFDFDEGSNPKRIFVLPDTNIDTTTIRVSVRPSASNTQSTVYNKVTDILMVDSTSEVYFLQEEKNGRYQIYFGDGIVGKQLVDGSVISVSYLVTNGNEANEANGFVATVAIDQYSDFIVDVVSVASGGSDRETVDEIRLNATSRFSIQNRLITFKDYESFILTNYTNIDSISVWGGEDNDPPVYGKVFISLKPKLNYFISDREKERIISDLLVNRSVVSIDHQIIDPEYLYLFIDTFLQYDSKKTTNNNNTLSAAVRAAIINYRDANLNKFAAKFVPSRLQQQIDSIDTNSIVGSKISVIAQKRFRPTLNTRATYVINFNVPLVRGTITNKLISNEFRVTDSTGVERTVSFEEIPQSSTGISSISVLNPGLRYTSTPTVTITGDGIGATAEAVVVNESIERIVVTNRGIGYSRASVTISGGGGYNAVASVIIDEKFGTLRTIYYDSNLNKKIVNENIATVDYETGEVRINDLRINSVVASDGLIRLNIETENVILESVKNTIITIDENDPASIVTRLDRI